MSDMMKQIWKDILRVPQNFKPLERMSFSVIAIQIHKQPIHGNNIQVGGEILSLGVVIKLKFNVFVTSVGDSLSYVLMRHA